MGTVQGTMLAAPGPAGAGPPLANGHRASPAGSPARDPRQLARAASPGLTQGAPQPWPSRMQPPCSCCAAAGDVLKANAVEPIPNPVGVALTGHAPDKVGAVITAN
jgi:hypothetical protein